MEFSRRAFLGSMAALVAAPKNVFSLPVAIEVPSVPVGLPMIRLFHPMSLAVQREMMPPGHWGIQRSPEDFEDLGAKVLMDIAHVYPKAIRIAIGGERPTVAQSYDPSSDLFRQIVLDSREWRTQEASHCMWGPEFLVKVNGEWMTYFAGSASTRFVLMPELNTTRMEMGSEMVQSVKLGFSWWRPDIHRKISTDRGLPRLIPRRQYDLSDMRWSEAQFKEKNGLYLPSMYEDQSPSIDSTKSGPYLAVAQPTHRIG